MWSEGSSYLLLLPPLCPSWAITPPPKKSPERLFSSWHFTLRGYELPYLGTGVAWENRWKEGVWRPSHSLPSRKKNVAYHLLWGPWGFPAKGDGQMAKDFINGDREECSQYRHSGLWKRVWEQCLGQRIIWVLLPWIDAMQKNKEKLNPITKYKGKRAFLVACKEALTSCIGRHTQMSSRLKT